MRVKCIMNSAERLSDELIQPTLGLNRDHIFSLKIGKEYVVYGMTYFLGCLWYYICDEDYTYYPIWNPSPLFNITDNRLSCHWEIAMHIRGDEMVPVISFREWVANPLFYDKLTDGDDESVQLFRQYKKLMDEE